MIHKTEKLKNRAVRDRSWTGMTRAKGIKAMDAR